MKLKDIKGKNQVIVNNPRRIKKLLGIDTIIGEDLLEKEEAKEFISKYKNLLFSYNPQDLKILEESSGLIVTNIIKMKYDSPAIYFNSTGVGKQNLGIVYQTSFNHDLAVIKYVNQISVRVVSYNDICNDICVDEKVCIDDKVIEDISLDCDSEDFFGNQKKVQINFFLKTIDEKVKFINEQFRYNLESKNIKEIKMDYFYNLLILYNDGKMYRNNILYDENVEYILNIDNYNTYLIYKDNRIGMYSSKEFFYQEISKKYTKILYKDYYFLATINRNKQLDLELAVHNFEDTSVIMCFENVDDINYNYYELDDNNWNEKLELISNGSTISIDLYYPSIFLETDMHKIDKEKCIRF